MRKKLARGVLAAFLVPGLPGALCCGCARPAQGPPNVLLITVDTLRSDYLGTYGFQHATSPNIDRLAGESVVFERAIAAAPSTMPSHASIFTSRYVRGHSVGWDNGATTLAGLTTLAERYQSAGYATAAFVGNMLLRRDSGFDRGFDVYDDELDTVEGNREAYVERLAEGTTQRALAWLDSIRGRPFFLWVHYQDPHGPYRPPPAFQGRIAIDPLPDEPRLPVVNNVGGVGSIPLYQAQPGLDRPSQYESLYADEILYADHWIGVLLDAVDAHTPRRETLVLFTADHGESFGEADRWFVHGFAATPQLAHVPLILRAPGLPAGRRPGLVSHVDILPTLLELSGLEPDPDAAGIALGPLLRAGRALPDRTVYCDAGFEVAAYRGDRFLRVVGAGFPWDREGDAPPDDGRTLNGLRFAWKGDDHWSLLAPAAQGEPVPEGVRRYVLDVVPMKRIERMPPKMVLQLQSLGYVVH